MIDRGTSLPLFFAPVPFFPLPFVDPVSETVDNRNGIMRSPIGTKSGSFKLSFCFLHFFTCQKKKLGLEDHVYVDPIASYGTRREKNVVIRPRCVAQPRCWVTWVWAHVHLQSLVSEKSKSRKSYTDDGDWLGWGVFSSSSPCSLNGKLIVSLCTPRI